MTLAVSLFGIFMAVVAIAGLISPPRLFAVLARLQSPSGLYFVAGFRLFIGAALILAAPDSRSPAYLRVFGVVALLAGIATPFFGVRRFEALLLWWRKQPLVLVRLWCVVALLIGVSFVWAVFPGAMRGN